MNIYEIRKLGREYCQTEGSEHYKGEIEPIDLIVSKGLGVDFCLGNIIKYAGRYVKTKNLNDIKKVSDYAHILCGIEINQDSFEKECANCKFWVDTQTNFGVHKLCIAGVSSLCNSQDRRFFEPEEATNEPKHP